MKPLSSKFDVRVSSEALTNCKESIKEIFLVTIIRMYFSIVLGITSVVSSKLFSSSKIMSLSHPSKLWEIIGSFFWKS